MKRSKILAGVVVGAALAVAGAAWAHDKGAGKEAKMDKMGAKHVMTMSSDQLRMHIAQWPEVSRKAASTMIEKYGLPDEITTTKLMWKERGPWLRSVVSKEPIDHDFPMPHKDVLQQVIPYKIDPQHMDEITAFDGSIVGERTKGELSARCDNEEANFLALNLADQIFKGRLSAADARAQYAKTVQAAMRGEKPALMSGLQFSPPDKLAAREADVTILRARAAEEVESPQKKKMAPQKDSTKKDPKLDPNIDEPIEPKNESDY